jgi:hypothetical protein
MINGAQCTILWHVDDLKISHVDKAVVEKMLSLGPDTDNYKKLRRVISVPARYPGYVAHA